MSILDDMKAEEAKLRGIRADGRETAWRNLGNSARSKRRAEEIPQPTAEQEEPE